jgi:hypothetical protein
MVTIQQLEKYTQIHPEEVLSVKAQEGEEAIEIMIFKGFSSSLTSATSSDPDFPILSDQGEILSIDRLKSPYNPENPQYIQRNLTLKEFAQLL